MRAALELVLRVLAVLAVTLAFVLLATLLARAAHAVPTAAISASDTSGPPPLGVHFDASGTTSSIGGDVAYRDLRYTWDYGDPTSGTWTQSSLPRNSDKDGNQAAHVYTGCPGNVFPCTYIVTVTVRDRNGGVDTETTSVTVTDPELTWSATTVCISNDTDFSGCPSGAAQVTSSDLDVQIGLQTNTNGRRRVLFNRGDTFTADNPGFGFPNVVVDGLISAYGEGADPVLRAVAGNNDCVFCLAGNSVLTPTMGGWRFVDVDIEVEGTLPAWGIKTFFLVRDILVYNSEIGPCGTGFCFGADMSGLTVPHENLFVVESTLGPSAGTVVTNTGTCYFGGALEAVVMGVTCNQVNQWQLRPDYPNRAVWRHVRVLGVAGGFEAIKFQCALEPLDADPGTRCDNFVFTDSYVEQTRVNFANGGNDNGTIQTALTARVYVNGCIENENPNNTLRDSIMRCAAFKPRTALSAQPRNNRVENITCHEGVDPIGCILINLNANVDGLLLRNILHFTPSNTPFLTDNSGVVATITQQTNQKTTTNPFTVLPTSPLFPAQYALPAASIYVNAGTAGIGPHFDAVGNPAPVGVPDIGAIELQDGGSMPAPAAFRMPALYH